MICGFCLAELPRADHPWVPGFELPTMECPRADPVAERKRRLDSLSNLSQELEGGYS